MATNLSRVSPGDMPVYLRAQQSIQEMVEGPDYSPGDKIPSERMLSQMMGISRMTVRKAIERLVDMGLLERHSTSGTRIAVPQVTRPLDDRSSKSLSQIVQSLGGRAGSKLLHFEAAQASAKIAERLRIAVGAPLIVIRRLRLANGTAFCVETSYLPAARVPGLAADDLLGDRSLYGLLAERYGIEVGSGEGLVSIAPATVMEAHLLGLDLDSPTLLYRAVVFDGAGTPVEYLTSVNHPQLVAFKTNHGEISW